MVMNKIDKALALQSRLITNDMRGIYPDTLQEFADLVRADERDAIYDQWHSCVMADLENGVKWLNEKAAAEWHTNYPAQSNLFPSWVESRGSR
jgi:hypothetical protein